MARHATIEWDLGPRGISGPSSRQGISRHDGTDDATAPDRRSSPWAWPSGASGRSTPRGPRLSTGSGVGTGAGAGAMSSREHRRRRARCPGANTGAGGAMSGRGPGSPMDSGTALPLGPRPGTVPFGPGVDVSFPTDPYLVPFLLPEEAANPVEGKAPSRDHRGLAGERPPDRRPGRAEPGPAADRQRRDRQQPDGPGASAPGGGDHRRRRR